MILPPADALYNKNLTNNTKTGILRAICLSSHLDRLVVFKKKPYIAKVVVNKQ